MRILRHSVLLAIWIAVAMTSLYVVANNLPPIVGSFRYFWGPAVLVAIFLMQPSVYKKKPMAWLLLFGATSLGLLQYTLWNHMSDWNRFHLLNEFYSLVIFSAIFFYYYVRKDFKGLAFLGKLGFYFIIITIIMTNIALFFDPLVVRMSVNAGRITPYQAKVFKITGAGGYGYMQALVCLIPILIYHIKFRIKMVFSRKGLIVIQVLIIITLVRAQVLANILVAVVIMIFSYAGAKTVRKSIAMVSLVLILLLAIPSSFYADMFTKIKLFFDVDSTMYSKLNDLSFFIQHPEFGGPTGAGGRADRYPLLFEALIGAPVLGDASYNSPFTYNMSVGYHLHWMNKLAVWGIPGFLFSLFVLFQLYKSIFSLFDDHFGFYYSLSVGAFVLLGLIKTIAGREPYLILIVIIPGLYFLPLLKQKRQRSKKITEPNTTDCRNIGN